jgi:16S rRNA (adenine1518-N6/adenine1519-N6)-dimethyltransferase
LIQKEVAERIARSKKESILSLSIKAYGEPKYIKTVPSGAFSPPPAVDSAILAITNISRQNFTDAEQEEKFFALVHAGFAQKRKLLKRNLESVLGKESSDILQKAGIPENTRAEDVALPQWLALSRFTAQ